MAALVALSFLFALLSSASACKRCLHQSKATFTSQISSGSCGYGPLALDFNGGFLAGGLPKLFKQGAGCGACFKNPTICNSHGVPVILTELQGDNRTDFLLNKDAFIAMAKKGAAKPLLNLGIVDIEYKRVRCVYNRNLALRVEDYSSKPYYLAIKVLYQGGQTEITAIDVAQVGSKQWMSTRRNYGAIWDANEVPSGPLKFRFRLSSGKYVSTQMVLPSNWRNALTYDAGLQITEIIPENCYPFPCDQSTW